jgi:Domain of unknown function DUF29
MDPRYNTDFYSWAMAQSELARTRSSNALDWDHVAEELRLLGVSEERELVSRLRVLIAHLLKCVYQPERETRSWQLTIANQRDELADHLRGNPGLKSKLSSSWIKAYSLGRRDAAIETELDVSTYPEAPAFTYEQAIGEQAIGEDWLPETPSI